jgi:predicted membrane protein
MPTDTRFTLTPQLIIGVFLILFGALLTLDRMQLLSAGLTLRYWPVALIALGTWIVVERRGTQRSLPGYVMIGIGALLLLDVLGVMRVRFWELFWPMIIVLVGARLIMHTPGQRSVRHGASATAMPAALSGAIPAPACDGTISMFSILGSDQRTSNDKPFRGGDVTTIVGGTQLDLRRASIEPGGEAVINIFVVMGGHDLWVPPGWTVSIEVMPILGGVEDKRLPPVLDDAVRAANTPAPRLVIRGVVLLGGLNLKN